MEEQGDRKDKICSPVICNLKENTKINASLSENHCSIT